MKTNKRKCYFVEKKFQAKYALLTILALLLYTMLFVGILFIPNIVPLYLDTPIDERARVARTLLTLHTNVWPAVGVVIVIMGILSIFVTHRIAGPVYRFKKILNEIANGNLNSPIKLRKKDDFKDLAEDMNRVIVDLKLFVNSLREDQTKLSRDIDLLEDQINSERIDTARSKELIENIRTNKNSITKTLAKYATDTPPNE